MSKLIEIEITVCPTSVEECGLERSDIAREKRRCLIDLDKVEYLWETKDDSIVLSFISGNVLQTKSYNLGFFKNVMNLTPIKVSAN
jgi:hypothetical protein